MRGQDERAGAALPRVAEGDRPDPDPSGGTGTTTLLTDGDDALRCALEEDAFVQQLQGCRRDEGSIDSLRNCLREVCAQAQARR